MAMFKAFSMMAQLAAFIGLMMTVPNVIRTAHQGNKMLQDNLKAAQGAINQKSLQGADKIGLNLGQDLAMQSPSMAILPKLMSMMNNGQDANATPDAPPEPPKCMTAICYNNTEGNDNQAGQSKVMKLPPGANAMFVDGKLQIYYPHGKPKQGR
jgi:hypothetical protein